MVDSFEEVRQRFLQERARQEAEFLAQTPPSIITRTGDFLPTVKEAADLDMLRLQAANDSAAQKGPVRLQLGSDRAKGLKPVLEVSNFPGHRNWIDMGFLSTRRLS